MSRGVSIWLTGLMILLLGGCAVSTPDTRNPVPASDAPNYRIGYRDGCTTAHGDYTKDSELFRNDKDYYDGWFAGRSTCQYR